MYRVSANPIASAPYVNLRWNRVGWTILVICLLTIFILALYITPRHADGSSLDDALYSTARTRGSDSQKDHVITIDSHSTTPVAEKQEFNQPIQENVHIPENPQVFQNAEVAKSPEKTQEPQNPYKLSTGTLPRVQMQYHYDGSKGPRYDMAKPITEYENLVFCTITPDFFNDQVADMIRSFVGGIHQLRDGLGHVPRIQVLVTVSMSDLPVDFLEEISWWNNVHFQNLQSFLGLPMDPQNLPANAEMVRLAVLDRLVKEHGHAIWIKFGYVFEPVWILVNDAEKKGAYQEIVDAYAVGREAAMKLAHTLQQDGFIIAQQKGEVRYSNLRKLKHPDNDLDPRLGSLYEIEGTVIEGYSRINGDEKVVEKKLQCLFSKDGCKLPLTVPPTTNDPAVKYGVYPVNPVSRSACHTDIRPESALNNVLVDFVAETSLTESSKRLLEESKTKKIRKIALGLPVTSRGQEEKGPVFLEILLPSFLKTVSDAEFSTSLITLYLGFDHGDQVFQNKQSRDKILDSATKLVGNKPIQFKMLLVPALNRVAMVWNLLYAHAIREGNDYFYQVNDDLHMVTPGWLTNFTSTLDANGGFGVVGPSDHNRGWNCTLLTQAMVTPMHFDIFRFLYPVELKNWTTDRWLTEVYVPDYKHCTTKIIATNGKANRRYRACDFLGWVVYVQVGKKILADWMAANPQYLLKGVPIEIASL